MGGVGRHPFNREAQGSRGPSSPSHLPSGLGVQGLMPGQQHLLLPGQAQQDGVPPSPAVEGRPFSWGLSWAE